MNLCLISLGRRARSVRLIRYLRFVREFTKKTRRMRKIGGRPQEPIHCPRKRLDSEIWARAGAEKVAILEIPMAFFRKPLRSMRTTVCNDERPAVYSFRLAEGPSRNRPTPGSLKGDCPSCTRGALG